MTWGDLLGQRRLIRPIQRDIALYRTVHAMIIAGPKGSGKSTLASIAARALLCTGEDKPCDACPCCKQVLHGNHPDLLWVRPEGRKTIVVDDVQAIQDALAVRPYQGQKRVVVIQAAHTMAAQAQNKLLKTLEEPPPYAVLILLADQTAPLLPTVISRCRMLRMQRVPEKEIAGKLVEVTGCLPEQAGHWAGMADGCVGRALEMATSGEYAALRKSATEALLDMTRKGGALRALGYLREMREQSGEVFKVWQTLLRDALVCHAGLRSWFHGDASGAVEALAKRWDAERLQRMLGVMMEAEKRLAGNAQYQLTCDWMIQSMEGCE